ncbi:MAG: hypothetical protein NVSMB28_00250 [Collimonas sp.]
MNEINDLTQIGLSNRMHPHLEALKNDGYFSEMRDAYRFAISLAIVKGGIPPELQKRQNIFATPTVDPDGSLAAAIRALMPCEEIPPYRWAERLAEVGVEILAARAAQGKLDIGSLLAEAESAAATETPEME